MRIIFVLSLLILSVTAEHRRNESISSFDEEMDDDVIPPHDPIWRFVRSPAEELWLGELGTEYPRIDMYGQEVSNMLQFMLLGRPDDIIMVVPRLPTAIAHAAHAAGYNNTRSSINYRRSSRALCY